MALQCFSDALAAAACAMSLRHLLEDPVWRLQGISAQARIALHVGHVLIQKDEFTSGDSHRVACRLESIVDPGAIWTSAAFAEALEQRAPRTALTTRYLGLKSLPKNDGQLECYELIDRSLSTPGRSQTSIPSYQPQDDPLANCQLLLRSNDETDQIAAIQALVAIGSWPAMRSIGCVRSLSERVEPRFRGRCLAALKQIADPGSRRYSAGLLTWKTFSRSSVMPSRCSALALTLTVSISLANWLASEILCQLHVRQHCWRCAT